MAQVKLDADFCRAVQPQAKKVEYADTEKAYSGLRFVVTPAGNKSFAFRSNPHFQKIGDYPACKLSFARTRVSEWKLALNAGQNPFAEIKAAKKAARTPEINGTPTLAQLWEQFSAEYLVTKSEKHRREADRSMRKHFLPVFGRLPFDEVPAKALYEFRIRHQKERLREMEQMKAYLSKMVRWMAEHELYRSAPFMASPPEFGRVERDRRANPGVRTRKLVSANDIRSYWTALREYNGPRGTMLAFQMIFLSNKRGIDVCRMRPEHVDFERQVWTLPITKNGRPLEQPLTPLMISIIKAALGNREMGYVFSNTMGDKQVVTTDAKLKRAIAARAKTEAISTHDFRRTMTTALQELGVPERVYKMMEGHYDQGVEAHYAQAERRPRDEQLAAYRKWEAFLAGEIDFPEWGAVA